MRNMTIGKRITLGFTIAVAITLGLGVYAYNRVSVIEGNAATIVSDCLPGTYWSGQINAYAQQNVSLLLQHILAEDLKAMEEVEQRTQSTTIEVDKAFKEYEATISTENDRQLYSAVVNARAAWLRARNVATALSRDMKKKEAMEAFRSQAYPAFVEVRKGVIALADENGDTGKQAGKAIVAAVTGARRGVVIAMGLAVVAATTLGLVIIRGTNQTLRRAADSLGAGAEQVAAASTQVSSASQSLAQGASEQAASLEETSSSLEEMSSMTKKNAETAQQAASLSAEAKHAADRGNAAMGKMSGAIQEIQKSASETAKIIKVIDEIAFQTNLLALNAAVEAARAGEAGKGFAVVAEEVRNLAMRSAEAAKNTSSLIEESVNNAKNGVSIAGEVGQVLAEITSSNAKVNSLVDEIAAATGEQAQGIQQVNTAVGQMDKVTQSNAANAEESASAAEELSAQAEQLRNVVGDLLALVGGSTQAKRDQRLLTPGRQSRELRTRSTPSLVAPNRQAFPLDLHEEESFRDFNKAA